MTYNKEAYYGHINTRGWSLYIAATDKGLCFVGSQNEDLDEMKDWFAKKRPKATLVEDWDKVATYEKELVEYFNGERQSFDLPVDFIGTNFQEAIWTELQNIPYGEKRTYTDIAKNIDRPSSVRAVGTAIGANPVMIVVPCHRVVGKNGKMTGFRGGIPMKESLLGLESS
ncbi:O-6-methylguanine DNA methyltransferase [Virgibacillus natechei]|uniref:O-6-methylguanine DNA methyltransferase n=1 Tax=Virgibacillus natechei TaxID=1216297 RepID=A0ABS4IKF8_9BACI|nr:methylated-DNA--[protein]-cysteine S-methyltransferase [Virgibacillus natechei]MBP1971399.1 O-6-methylguanine DNA methyltransferase [Virgibacillus natechei]UZD12232.1 methylated-DNA--[protein]-cysteine S-methyltransferase [Virgibacillus natechei]